MRVSFLFPGQHPCHLGHTSCYPSPEPSLFSTVLLNICRNSLFTPCSLFIILSRLFLDKLGPHDRASVVPLVPLFPVKMSSSEHSHVASRPSTAGDHQPTSSARQPSLTPSVQRNHDLLFRSKKSQQRRRQSSESVPASPTFPQRNFSLPRSAQPPLPASVQPPSPPAPALLSPEHPHPTTGRGQLSAAHVEASSSVRALSRVVYTLLLTYSSVQPSLPSSSHLSPAPTHSKAASSKRKPRRPGTLTLSFARHPRPSFVCKSMVFSSVSSPPTPSASGPSSTTTTTGTSSFPSSAQTHSLKCSLPSASSSPPLTPPSPARWAGGKTPSQKPPRNSSWSYPATTKTDKRSRRASTPSSPRKRSTSTRGSS